MMSVPRARIRTSVGLRPARLEALSRLSSYLALLAASDNALASLCVSSKLLAVAFSEVSK